MTGSTRPLLPREEHLQVRHRAKARRDALIAEVQAAERRGDSSRVALLRDEIAQADRLARAS